MIERILGRIADRRGGEMPFPEDLDHFLDDFFPNTVLKNETLQKAFSVTESEMKELYRLAYTHYQKENYSLAHEHYRFLVILDPFERLYWMGYAASLQLLHHFEKALHGYAVAALLDQQDPICHYHAHECYLALHNSAEAFKALSLAEELCGEKDEYKHLKERITLETKSLAH